MSFDRSLKKVRKRITAWERAIAERREDRAAAEVLDPNAGREAADLWEAAQPADSTRPDHLESLRLTEARRVLGRLHLYRATGLQNPQLRRELAEGIVYLAPIAERPGAVPPGYDQYLGPAADPDAQGGLGAEMLGADADAGGVFADAAVALLTESLARTPRSSPGYLTRLSNLGSAHLTRYRRNGEPTDLERAHSLLKRAVEGVARKDPNWAMYQFNFGQTHLERYLRAKSPADAKAAAGLLDQAIAGLPAGSPMRSAAQSAAVTAHRGCAEDGIGGRASRDRAIRLCRELLAIKSGAADAPHQAELGWLLMGRWLDDSGPGTDIDEAVDCLRDAVAATPPGDPALAERQSRLGVVYRRRYEEGKSRADLEAAIDWGRQAVASGRPGTEGRGGHLTNIGVACRERYELHGYPADLDFAVHYGEQAVAADPDDDAGRAISLHNLCAAYRCRYDRTGDRADIDLAVDAAERGVAATPSGHPLRQERLNRLAAVREVRDSHRA
ncbi:hypothetical protein [Amycolatopsis sp. NPDC004378]